MKTLLLDTAAWDLVLDVNGNIALASEPYSLAQDAASADRTFAAECWYNTVIGVRYNTTLLGKPLNVPLIKSELEAQALTVPGVVSAKCFITSFVNRRVTGQVQITDVNGDTSAAGF